MLSFFMKPRSQTSFQGYRGQLKSRVTKPLYKTGSQDLIRTTGYLQRTRRPRTAADEISTCRS